MNKYIYHALVICMLLQLRGVLLIGQSDIMVVNESEINTAFQEYSPAFFKNGIVFVTSNPNVTRNKAEDNQTGKITTSIFWSKCDQYDHLQKPVPFSDELTTKFYDGPVSFNATEDIIFFTRSNVKGNKPKSSKDGSVHLKIFSAELEEGKWGNAEELPFNSDKYDCVHPSVSADGKKLYFSSNRPGGYGGMDLYVATLINGEWSEPVNLGPLVNSPKNEVFPFISDDGKLYFSSDGHQGFGNLDIHFTVKAYTGWKQPVILPEPINSRSDDFGIIMSEDKSFGYFASNRASGKGDDDIYRFIAPRGLHAEPLPELTEEEEEEESIIVANSVLKEEIKKDEMTEESANSDNNSNIAHVFASVKSIIPDSATTLKNLPIGDPIQAESAKEIAIVTVKNAAEIKADNDNKTDSKTEGVDTNMKLTRTTNPIKKSSDVLKENKKYWVIIGTYTFQENAYEQYEKAIRKGYSNCEIIKYEDRNLFGVCIKRTNSEKEAFEISAKIKHENMMDAFVKVLK